MVEIRYGEHYEMADLAGKSVAQAREQYKQEFDIPDKAKASPWRQRQSHLCPEKPEGAVLYRGSTACRGNHRWHICLWCHHGHTWSYPD